MHGEVPQRIVVESGYRECTLLGLSAAARNIPISDLLKAPCNADSRVVVTKVVWVSCAIRRPQEPARGDHGRPRAVRDDPGLTRRLADPAIESAIGPDERPVLDQGIEMLERLGDVDLNPGREMR